MNTPLPSNRSFALVFFVFFLAVGLVSWWQDGRVYPYFFALSVVVGVVGLLMPALLTPCNRVWMRFADLLHRVVNPVVLAVLFFGIVTPFAFVMRMVRRDLLQRAFEPTAKSYWINRHPPGPDGDSMNNQF